MAEAEVTVPQAPYYPDFVGETAAARHRWDLSVAAAAKIMDEPPESQFTRLAASRLFHSPAATA